MTHEVAIALAEKEFEKFHAKQNENIESDFDKVVKKLYGSGLKGRKDEGSER